nr:MAG TPA: hypothetical protein [Bacteriophage sp.]DAM11537.1 MAG TPA: hypothetical protein [Caudoviricetes sp.]
MEFKHLISKRGAYAPLFISSYLLHRIAGMLDLSIAPIGLFQ